MHLNTKARIPLVVLASQVASLPTGTEQTNTTGLSLNPFIDVSLTLQPPTFTTDFSGQVGLLPQVGTPGSFSGQLSGTIPPVGNFELNYPPRKGAHKAYGTGSFVLNTTKGETLLLRVQGPIVLDGVTQSAAGNLFATIETRTDSLSALNWKSFLFAFNGSQSDGVQSGGGIVYEVMNP